MLPIVELKKIGHCILESNKVYVTVACLFFEKCNNLDFCYNDTLEILLRNSNTYIKLYSGNEDNKNDMLLKHKRVVSICRTNGSQWHS